MFDTDSGAIFSDCKKYRYLLWRTWSPLLRPMGFLMLNPSTADAVNNDPTVERCERRARKQQCGGLIVANIYAWRATDPKNMMAAADPIGPENNESIRKMAEACAVVVCAWGSHADPPRAAHVVALIRSLPNPPHLVHLGLTKSGQPRHPLYISYDETKAPYLEMP